MCRRVDSVTFHLYWTASKLNSCCFLNNFGGQDSRYLLSLTVSTKFSPDKIPSIFFKSEYILEVL